MGEQAYTDEFWQSSDGLSLHYRDYAGNAERPPILCLPGLTRNARDFEPVADAFAGEWRIIAAEFRGRGKSDYAKDSATYSPVQYTADVIALMEQAKVDRAVFFGTSLGGLVTMLVALQKPELIAGVILNDIGPELDPEGLDKIKNYVGQGGSFPTWMHAARALRESSATVYPDFAISEWLQLTKRLMCVSGNGRIAFDYDMKVAEPIMTADPDKRIPDGWPAFRALAGRPVLTLRGELSDLLSEQTFARMQTELPEMTAVTVPGVGHVPTLDEPVAQSAIADLLAKVA